MTYFIKRSTNSKIYIIVISSLIAFALIAVTAIQPSGFVNTIIYRKMDNIIGDNNC